jgi:magnesium-transporting ATPase (P-type)
MENIKKIKKSALVLLVAVSLVMLYYIIIFVVNIALHGFVLYPVHVLPDGSIEVQFNLAKNILYFMQTFIMLSVQICAAFLLLSIKKDETPFRLRNVKLLKSIAIILMAFEPLQVIAEMIPLTLVGGSIVMDDGTTLPLARSTYFPSGVIFVVGIVVYCVALIFNYGISLQKQSDETL